jgi:hypothetical protein
MGATRKIAIGLGLAGSAVLATWFLTGDRKKKTRELIAKKAGELKQTMKKVRDTFDDSEPHYI